MGTDPNTPQFDVTRTFHDAPQTLPVEGGAASALDGESRFGSLRLLRLLGEGGMGAVYEAEDAQTQRIVALKVPHAAGLDRERLLEEARIAASISHPNCVFVYGSVESAGRLGIAMELVKGVSARDRVDSEGPLSLADAVRYTLDILSGLEAAHRKGVLHRDIKPANIFLDSVTGVAKVGDFGLSLSRPAPGDTSSNSFAGTPAYASPEQLQGLMLDLRSDIYSVGATLYFLLTGRAPFMGTDIIQLVASIAARDPEPPSKWNKQVPPEIDDVVLRALKKRPEDRFQDYASFRAALTPEFPAPPMRRIVAGGLDLCIVSAATAFWAKTSPPAPALLGLLATIAIYAALGGIEGRWGFTPGKWACSLRVRRNLAPPGWRIGLLRGLLFGLLVHGLSLGVQVVQGAAHGWNAATEEDSPWDAAAALCKLAGMALPFVLARRWNGWIGLHDRWSGSRVTLLRRNSADAADSQAQDDSQMPVEGGSEKRLGPFLIVSAASQSEVPIPGVQRGWDPQLRRQVWIVERAPSDPPLPVERQNVHRRGCLRWIGSERKPGEAWDAYEAPAGQPLTRLTQPLDLSRLSGVLSDLITENTSVDPNRVWIAADRGILCDFPVSNFAIPGPSGLAACARFAVLGEAPPVPVGELLANLEAGRVQANEAVAHLRELSGGGACTVSRGRRLLQLAIGNILALPMVPVIAVVAVVKPSSAPEMIAAVMPILIAIQAGSGLAAAAAIGVPLSFSLSGLALTSAGGVRVSRWRAMLRQAIPFGLSLTIAILEQQAKSGAKHSSPIRHPVLIFAYSVIMAAGFLHTLWKPSQGLLERITGVWVARK